MIQIKRSIKTASLLGFIFGVLVFASPTPSVARDESDYLFNDGNALLTVCGQFVSAVEKSAPLTQRDQASLVACATYLRGFSHGVAVLSNEPEQGHGYCIDSSVPTIQIARVIVKSLKDSPADLHYHPAPLVVKALRRAFPCQKP